MTLQEIQDAAIEQALAEHGGNVIRAARQLQVSAKTIRRWRRRRLQVAQNDQLTAGNMPSNNGANGEAHPRRRCPT